MFNWQRNIIYLTVIDRINLLVTFRKIKTFFWIKFSSVRQFELERCLLKTGNTKVCWNIIYGLNELFSICSILLDKRKTL